MAVSHLFRCKKNRLFLALEQFQKTQNGFCRESAEHPPKSDLPGARRSIFRAESASSAPAAPGLEERPQKRETFFLQKTKKHKKNDTCAWTPNSVFQPAWVAKQSRRRQVQASLGKCADTRKSWPSGLLGAGLGKSRQVQASLGKQATTGNPGFQAIGSWARQVQASRPRQEILDRKGNSIQTK